MTTRSGPSGRADPVALLVVHGIGSQQRGQTLAGLLGGLKLAYGAALTIRQDGEDHAVLEGIGRPVHLLEVYWADLLHGEVVKRTFDFNRVFEMLWFPLLNYRSGSLSAEVCPHNRLLWWTAVLAPLCSLLYAGYWGARFLASVPAGIQKAWRERDSRQLGRNDTLGFWARVHAKREDPDRARTIIDELADQVAGDVFNYVQGVAKSFPEDNEHAWQLTRNVSEIGRRFLCATARATALGCSEIQILAHSMGTVVAFLAMCPAQPPAPSSALPARLSRFYTIGSPLEKMRFFWTPLFEHARNGPAIVVDGRLLAAHRCEGEVSTMQWENFFSRLDLVSGRLLGFPGWPTPRNHTAAGLGGLITAHTAYNSNPVFLALLTEGLTGIAPQAGLSHRRRFWPRLLATLESLLLPAALMALAMLGMVFFGGMGWFSGWFFSRPLAWLGLERWAAGVQIYFAVSMLFVAIVVSVINGYTRATKLHARFWARGQGPAG